MFDHVSIGVSDIKRAGRFYDAALGPLGDEAGALRRLAEFAVARAN